MIQVFVVFVVEFQCIFCFFCMYCINICIVGLIVFLVWWVQSVWIVNGVLLNGSLISVLCLSLFFIVKCGRKFIFRFFVMYCLIFLIFYSLMVFFRVILCWCRVFLKICWNMYWGLLMIKFSGICCCGCMKFIGVCLIDVISVSDCWLSFIIVSVLLLFIW